MELRFLFFSLLAVFLSSCNPDELTLEIRSEDIESARAGEVPMIPAVFKFSMLGNDEDASLEKASEIVRRYIPKESKVSISSGQMGKILTITTVIPMVDKSAHKEMPVSATSLLTLILMRGQSSFPEYPTMMVIAPIPQLVNELNRELSAVNFALKFTPLAKVTNMEIEGDEPGLEVMGVAAFVDGQASIMHVEKLNKRQKATFSFKASVFEAASIWDQIPIQVYLR